MSTGSDDHDTKHSCCGHCPTSHLSTTSHLGEWIGGSSYPLRYRTTASVAAARHQEMHWSRWLARTQSLEMVFSGGASSEGQKDGSRDSSAVHGKGRTRSQLPFILDSWENCEYSRKIGLIFSRFSLFLRKIIPLLLKALFNITIESGDQLSIFLRSLRAEGQGCHQLHFGWRFNVCVFFRAWKIETNLWNYSPNAISSHRVQFSRKIERQSFIVHYPSNVPTIRFQYAAWSNLATSQDKLQVFPVPKIK